MEEVAAVTAKFLPSLSANQVVTVRSNFDHLTWDTPSGSVRVLDQDVVVDFENCECVSGGVVEFSTLLAAGDHSAFKFFWFALPLVGERALV